MAGGPDAPSGPDLAGGIPLEALEDGAPVAGVLDGEAVLVVRQGEEIFATGATCTHYGGPLAEGLVVGDTVRCPWHHACFSLRTGEATCAPALNPLPRWEVEVRDGRAWLGARTQDAPLSARGRSADGPGPVVIVGAGAAGSAAAETLRREGYGGRVVLVDPDPDAPYDRPNISKDYLAGSAPEAWIPLRPPGFYEEHGVERVRARATALEPDARLLRLDSGDALGYGALLLATGATPVRLPVPGADLPHVHVLRSLADSRAIIRAAESARSAVVVGASFIGMEAAASLLARGLDVTVVAPETVPFERTLGAALGRRIMAAHEAAGTRFRLGRTLSAIEGDGVVLDDGSRVAAELVVVGVGVRPDVSLAEGAGLEVDRGVSVDDRLRTSDPRVWAAGDIARWPHPRWGRIRVEHWVHAQRQGQAAAKNILGADRPFLDAPFFWTRQLDLGVAYVGHASGDARIETGGDPAGGDASFRYLGDDGRLLALATIGRDGESLETEARMEDEARRSLGPGTPSPAAGGAS